jgi:uncharacterized cupredoxin-like copper-binding protein
MVGRGKRVSTAMGHLAGRIRRTSLPLLAVAAGMLVTAAPAPATSGVHRVTLAMREFALQPAVLYLKAGERVELVLQNRGAAEHEWSAGRGLVDVPYEKGFRTDLLAILKPQVRGQGYHVEQLMTAKLDAEESIEGETARRLSQEVVVQPGGYAVLDFTVPQSAKGRWRMGCFLPGQYESGMYGAILIE